MSARTEERFLGQPHRRGPHSAGRAGFVRGGEGLVLRLLGRIPPGGQIFGNFVEKFSCALVGLGCSRLSTGLSGSVAAIVLMTDAKSIFCAAASVSSVSASPPFSETSSCGSSIAAGGSCTVSVSFAPTASGSATGTLSAASSAPGADDGVMRPLSRPAPHQPGQWLEFESHPASVRDTAFELNERTAIPPAWPTRRSPRVGHARTTSRPSRWPTARPRTRCRRRRCRRSAPRGRPRDSRPSRWPTAASPRWCRPRSSRLPA